MKVIAARAKLNAFVKIERETTTAGRRAGITGVQTIGTGVRRDVMTGRIVHYHIYKNAGSSIDWLLQHSFGPSWATFEGAHPHDVQTAQQLSGFLVSHPSIRAVSSHLARPPLPSPRDKAIVMLRHPIDRLMSVFAFARKDASQPDHAIAASGQLSEYVSWALDSQDGGVVIRDYQVIHLSRASFDRGDILKAVANRYHLEEATDLLSSFGVFGLVRQFARSCEFFMQHYGDAFPELKMFPRRVNETQSQSQSETDVIERVHSLLDSRLYRRLIEVNELDLALYDWAVEAFQRRC